MSGADSSSAAALRRFCRNWLIALVVLAPAVAALNAAVDPFRIIGTPDIPGVNKVRPESEDRPQLVKPYMVLRAAPQMLILGSSKAQVGIDPHSPRLPPDAGRVFNLGIAGAPLWQWIAAFEEVTARAPVRRVLLLADLVDFMSPPDAAQDAAEAQFHFLPDFQRRVTETLNAVLSRDALESSIATVAAQGNAYHSGFTEDGMMGQGSFEQAADAEGAASLFIQKRPLLIALFQSMRTQLQGEPGAGIADLRELGNMIAFCRAHGIALDIAITPVHAEELRIMVQAGLWPRYLAAKAAVVATVAEGNNAGAGGPSARLWDFLGFDAFSTEAVPPPSDRHARTQWFWEPNHFRPALGEKILDTIYRQGSEFGHAMTAQTAAPQLADETLRMHADQAAHAEVYGAIRDVMRGP